MASDAGDFLLPYLRKYGFQPVDAASWEDTAGQKLQQQDVTEEDCSQDAAGASPSASSTGWPLLQIQVTGHEEKEKHTWYSLQCCLQLPMGDRKLEWLVSRRLSQMREELHDPVKLQMLPDLYSQHFGKTPFAHRGGLPGTTARLKSWFNALGDCISTTRDCTPSTVGLTLRFLDPPPPPSLTGSARAAVGSVADKMKSKMDFMKTRMHEKAEGVKASVKETQESMAETATATAVNFSKKHPEMAKKGMAMGAGYAQSNPTAAAQATKMMGGHGLSFAAKNPKMAMQFAKITAKTVAKTA
eukprot:TRINITY_DN47420_c0_g1_i2.p1 TRINITY_DN47420_c0_g1~~TRINITY_DN47420_c0_g1_i2.p1  ORF type:complete len:300 (+),score=95.99 TRINITY_DN47420_c0_g1_i2:103-1002(+)